MWPVALSRVFIVNLYNLNCRIITYNTDTSPSLTHRSMRLTKLKTLINILESEARFWSNSLTFRFTGSDNILISSNFRDNSQTQTNIYTSCTNSIWTFQSQKISSIRPLPHTKKSLCNYRLTLALQRLFSNPHKNMRFPRKRKTEKYTVPNISSFNSSF